jgi:hypothetical protein
MDDSVTALAIRSNLVYAGGAFTSAGAVTANHVAVWNGSTWAALGSGAANGVDGDVRAILVDGTDVYVGGRFTTAGGLPASAVAKWDGSSWSALGSGLQHSSSPTVYGLAMSGTNLYVSGRFTTAGGVAARGIARWDGAAWHALGSGIGTDMGVVLGNDVLASGDDVYVCGVFFRVGVCSSGCIARWNEQINFAPASMMRLLAPEMGPGPRFQCHAIARDQATYAMEVSTDYTDWFPISTNTGNTCAFTDPSPTVGALNYRMRQLP